MAFPRGVGDGEDSGHAWRVAVLKAALAGGRENSSSAGLEARDNADSPKNGSRSGKRIMIFWGCGGELGRGEVVSGPGVLALLIPSTPQ